MNLSETLQVDPENFEVALTEIQFPHLWYNMRKDKYFLLVGTILLQDVPLIKELNSNFMKEIKLGYFSNVPEMVAELNAKIPRGPNIINLHSDDFDIRFHYDSFRLLWLCLMEYQ